MVDKKQGCRNDFVNHFVKKPGTGGLSAAASDGRMILDLIDYISIYNVTGQLKVLKV